MKMPDLIEKILEKVESKRFPCHTNRASSLGYAVPALNGCIRRGIFERTKWQEKEMPDKRTQLIFAEGNLHEDKIIKDLVGAGILLIEQQSAFEWKTLQITGHIDAVILVDGKPVPLEIKSMSPFIFDTVNVFEDFKKKPWTRAYMAQISLYMLAKDIDQGIFLLKNKSTGEIKQVDVALDYELAEACLKTAETINDHIANGTIGEKHVDVEVCKQCPFKLQCCPDLNFGCELKIADDPIFEGRIAKHVENLVNMVDLQDNEELIKARAKASCDEFGELNMKIGPYILTGKKDLKGAFRGFKIKAC